jgi:hypothetical protein
MDTKNTGFDADFKSVEKDGKKIHQKGKIFDKQ